MQVGGVLPSVADESSWKDHPQRIEAWLLFLGLIVTGAFLLFGIASWLGSIPTKAAVFIGAVPPVLFIVAGVYLLRNPDGSVSLNPEELYWRWPVGAGFLVAACACLVLLWWAKDDYDQARNGSQVVHKWQYRVRIIYQQVLGPLLTGRVFSAGPDATLFGTLVTSDTSRIIEGQEGLFVGFQDDSPPTGPDDRAPASGTWDNFQTLPPIPEPATSAIAGVVTLGLLEFGGRRRRI